MDNAALKKLLESVKSGETEISDAMLNLSEPGMFEDLGYAKVDHSREKRSGAPEVIYGEGKTNEQIVGIFKSMMENGSSPILCTRATREKYEAVAQLHSDIEYDDMSRIIRLKKRETPDSSRMILVATGGTSDLPVAEEAAVTAECLGGYVERLYDVGVAGIHRLLSHKELIEEANVIVAVAGMEGALPSVIGGLVKKPVIAVPTSVGYGASFNGAAALLGMLNSCASGLSVVNIDNGFGAGFLAVMINNMNI